MENERDEASYKQFLEDKVAEQEAEIVGLKAQIAELKKQRGISSAKEGMTFHQRYGIWTDKAGQHFCPNCMGNEKRNPLKTEEHGWRCHVCHKWFENPDRPIRVDRGGGGSWMGA